MALIIVTPTISASPDYSANDCVGGKITLAGAVLAGGAAYLDSILITDAANQKAALELFLFNADPAGTFTDNGALAISAADLTKVIARIPIATADYLTVDSKAVASLGNLRKVVQAAAGGSALYAAMLTTGTPNFAAADDLRLAFGFQRF